MVAAFHSGDSLTPQVLASVWKPTPTDCMIRVQRSKLSVERSRFGGKLAAA